MSTINLLKCMDKIIMGAMCVSGNIEILNISILNLIKHSNYVLLLLDNETDEVNNIVLEYQKKYYHKVFVRRSSIPNKLINKNGNVLDIHKRWKSIKGIVRDEMFVNIRRMIKMNLIPNIDILLIPDADEIFTNYLPELLDRLWISDKKGVSLKMVHVVNDMFTIKKDIMMNHLHIVKWSDDLCGYPWQYQNYMHPLTTYDTINVDNYSVHLCYLTQKQREWRNNNWKNNNLLGCELWKLPKIVTEMSPEEINNIFNREPDEKLS